MRNRRSIVVAAAVAFLVVAPSAMAGGVLGLNPIVNGDFELYFPEAIYQPLEETPLDECIGIGHQAFYGTDSPQGRWADAAEATADESDTSFDVRPGEPSVEEEEDGSVTIDPNTEADLPSVATQPAQDAVNESAEDPQGDAEKQAGYGYCVYSTEDGYDVVWLNPVGALQKPALHWSFQWAEFNDYQGDGDREVKIPYDLDAPSHNLWQAYPSPFQGFTADFDALELDVEGGEIAPNALIQVSLSATPLEAQTPRLLLFLDCGLNFHGSDLIDSMDETGHVAMDPADAEFFARSEDCQSAADAWSGATDEERHDILARLRIVQVSFWGFNGLDPAEADGDGVILDDVSLTNARTAAEAAADPGPNLVDPPGLD